MEKGRYAERQWLALIASAGRETVGRTTTDKGGALQNGRPYHAKAAKENRKRAGKAGH
jgi:hypothetical protein